MSETTTKPKTMGQLRAASPQVADPSFAAANALFRAGLIGDDEVTQASSILTAFVQPAKLDYATDAGFLKEAMEHHCVSYVNTVLVPRTMATANARSMGKLLTDEEVNKTSEAVTTLVILELGEPYKQRMYAYFGNEEGLVAHVFKRVHDHIYRIAIEENQKFISQTISRDRMVRVTSVNDEQGEGPSR